MSGSTSVFELNVVQIYKGLDERISAARDPSNPAPDTVVQGPQSFMQPGIETL